MVYIPFLSLLGIQAALDRFMPNQPEPESVMADHFINPTLGGGSLLDKDSGGGGEPLNVGLFFACLVDHASCAASRRAHVFLERSSFPLRARPGSSRTADSCTL